MNTYDSGDRDAHWCGVRGTHSPTGHAAAVGEPGPRAASEPARAATSGPSPHSESPCILVVGGGESGHAVVREALDSLAPLIDVAPDEQSAQALRAQRRYDLLVLLPRPGADAIGACRRLRAPDGTVPLLVLDTARLVDVVAALQAGADAYLAGPFHAGELCARVTALLRRRGAVSRGRPVAATYAGEAAADNAALPGAPPARPDGSDARAIRATARSATGSGMKLASRLGRYGLAAALIAAGTLGGYAVQAAQPAASAASVSTATTKQAATAAAIDAATERAFAIAGPSVVYVDNVGVGSGSGVIFDGNGDIVTNAHVVSGAQRLTVTLSTGKTYVATIVGTDTADDLAVIHINASGLTPARFAAAGSYTVAEVVLAIGSPLGLQQSVTSGLISALNRTVQESNGATLTGAIQTSAPINPGNSGGALVDLAGEVVGIPTLEATDSQNNNGSAAQGIGFAVSSGRVTQIARQIIANGRDAAQ